MSHRLPRPAGVAPLVAAVTLAVIGLGGASGATGAAAHPALDRAHPGTHADRAGTDRRPDTTAPAKPASAGAPPLVLLHQSPWVLPNPPGSPQSFTLDIRGGAGISGSDQVVVTLYDRLQNRSTFEQTLTSAPQGVLDRAGPLPWSSLPATGGQGGVDVRVEVVPDPTAAPSPAPGAPNLDLQCTPDTGTCPGVYPVVVTLDRPTGAEVGRFTTYLTYSEVTSVHQLRFAWVVPAVAPVTFRPQSIASADAIAPTSRTAAAALVALAGSLAQNPSVPVTVAASPQTLQGLRGSGATGRQAVAALGSLSATPAVHQFLAQPYVPIDLGALAGAGEPTEIQAQMVKGAAVLSKLGVRTTGAQSPWVATGRVEDDLASGLSQTATTEVVVPESTLVPAGAGGRNGTWAATFSLPLGHGTTVRAASSDTELAAHFTADSGDPALAANQLLADLAMIHFEEPNTVTVRGALAVPPAGWTPNATFDDQLLAGLDGNPNVQATTLSDFFSQVPGTATQPTRRLQDQGGGPVLLPSLAHLISAARLKLTAFDSAAPGSPPVLGQLDQLLLASEDTLLNTAGKVAGLRAFTRSLDGQLSLISLATERTVTLTARTGHIPVTVLSSAPYTVDGTLSEASDRFIFPDGASQQISVDRPTTPVRVAVQARTSGDLPINVTFVSPSGGLVIARAVITVRSTSTSVVGVVLTALALVVLLAWWARTWTAGRRRRAASARPPSDQ